MYKIKLDNFEGPFNLLLRLIEKEKLDITEISLTEVTDEFLANLNRIEEIRPGELADFLEIAAKLLLIKSRLLIPRAFEDESAGDDLVNQLKIYRQFLEASKNIHRIIISPRYAFAREKIPLKATSGISSNIRIRPGMLERYFKNVLNLALAQTKLTRRTIRRKIISLREKVKELLNLIKERREIILNHLMGQKAKDEKVVTFLAVLELIKRKTVTVSQKGLFKDIIVRKIQ